MDDSQVAYAYGGTAIVVSISGQGIVLTIDSMVTPKSSNAAIPTTMDKTLLLRDQVCVGAIGDGGFQLRDAQGNVTFTFQILDWIEDATKNIPDTIFCVSSVVAALKAKAHTDAAAFGRVLRNGGSGWAAVVAGFENGAAVVQSVFIEADDTAQNSVKVTDGKTAKISSNGQNFEVLCWGFEDQKVDIAGDAFTQAIEQKPRPAVKIFPRSGEMRANLTSLSIVGERMIRIASNRIPGVGPPFSQTTLSRTGRVFQSEWRS